LRPILFLILFFHYAFTSSAQLSDSLQEIIFVKSKNYANQKSLIENSLKNYSHNDFNQTITFATKAIDLAFTNRDSTFAGELFQERGSAQYFYGHYDKAAADFYLAIKILQASKAKKSLALTYNELAKLYRKTKDFTLSLENYNKALSLYTSLKDSFGIAMILNESGMVHEFKKEYLKAIENYQASYKIATIIHDSIGISYALSFIAGTYTIQKKYQLAEDYLLQSLSIRHLIADSLAIALNYNDLGMNASAAGKYTKGEEWLQKSNVIASQLNYPELLSANYSQLASNEENQGNYKKALDYFRHKTIIEDSIYSIEKSKQIEQLSTQYQTEKKERQLLVQSAEIKRKNIIIVGVFVSMMLLTLLAISYYRRRKLKQDAEFQQQLSRKKHEATQAVFEAEEREKLRIARDLHDGVGQLMTAAKMNLSAFYHEMNPEEKIYRQTVNKIMGIVDDSCREIRTVSHNMIPNALINSTLAKALNSFVDQLDNKSLKVHLFTEGLAGDLSPNIQMMVYRIIQECVNNVIKHANATVLDISVINEVNELTLTIEDDGKGFSMSENNSDGIGMQTIRARIDYLNGTFEITSAPGKGTLVAISVPISEQISSERSGLDIMIREN
jgi:signal transduction histidine kinase